jgi:hypothetical protein
VKPSDGIRDLATYMFGIDRHWHKANSARAAGPNALQPYRHNPPDRTIGADDIVFCDFGRIEEWEPSIPKLTDCRSACEARHDPPGEFFNPRPALVGPATCDVAHAKLLQSMQVRLDLIERVRRE